MYFVLNYCLFLFPMKKVFGCAAYKYVKTFLQSFERILSRQNKKNEIGFKPSNGSLAGELSNFQIKRIDEIGLVQAPGTTVMGKNKMMPYVPLMEYFRLLHFIDRLKKASQ